MSNKFFTYENNPQLLDILKTFKRPLIFTNGVFDIIHVGHVKYLQASKNLGSSLIVGVNSNKSVKLLEKGPHRPINSELDRAEIISSLSMVDFCVIFDDQTPIKLIDIIKPNIYTKGDDYNMNTISYSDKLEKMKIDIHFIPLIKGKSSTEIIKKITNI